MESAKRQCRFQPAAALAEGLMSRQRELYALCPFLGYEPYAVYGPDWEAKRLRDLAEKTQGSKGSLLAVLPHQARGRADPYDDGRFERWQDSGYDDSKWKTLSTTAGWECQGYIDENGHPFRGLMWYRMNVEVPASAAGKEISLCIPAVVNEAWVWVNGRYAGHRPYQMSWSRPQALEMQVTKLIEPGHRNQITFRVFNNIDVFGASGIYERGFLYQLR